MPAYGFRLSNGVDLGNTFAARVSTARAAVGYRSSAGTDLASLLEPLHGSTAKVGATGHRMSNGVDLNLAFDTVAGIPQNFTATPTNTAATSMTASASCSINSDGTISSTGQSGLKWFSNTIVGIGAQYQVLFHVNSVSGSTFGGTFDTWLALSTSRSASISVTTLVGKPGRSATGQLAITIRDADTLATVCTGVANFSVASKDDSGLG